MSSHNKIKITLIRSPIGRIGNHKGCLAALGLKRMNHSVVHFDTPTIRGMVNKIDYLLKVEEIA